MLEKIGRCHTAEYIMLFTFKYIFDDANRVNPESFAKAMKRALSAAHNNNNNDDLDDDSLTSRSSETTDFYDKIYKSDLELVMAYFDGLMAVAMVIPADGPSFGVAPAGT